MSIMLASGGQSSVFRLGRDDLGRRRHAQVQRPIRGVEIVHAHVADRARAEVPPPAPLERHIHRVVRPKRRRPQPRLPVERLRNRRRLLGPLFALRPPAGRSIGPHMQLAARRRSRRCGPLPPRGGSLPSRALADPFASPRRSRARPRPSAALRKSIRASGFSQ